MPFRERIDRTKRFKTIWTLLLIELLHIFFDVFGLRFLAVVSLGCDDYIFKVYILDDYSCALNRELI